jgi:hypothetical protein
MIKNYSLPSKLPPHTHQKIKNNWEKFIVIWLSLRYRCSLESVIETGISGALIVGVYMWKSIHSAPEKKKPQHPGSRVRTASGIRPAQPDPSFFPILAIVIMCTPSTHPSQCVCA